MGFDNYDFDFDFDISLFFEDEDGGVLIFVVVLFDEVDFKK